MENIIQQIAEKLIHKILERAYSGGITDIDALSSDVLGDCKEAARGIVEAITARLNKQIRDDKERRKAEGRAVCLCIFLMPYVMMKLMRFIRSVFQKELKKVNV